MVDHSANRKQAPVAGLIGRGEVLARAVNRDGNGAEAYLQHRGMSATLTADYNYGQGPNLYFVCA